MVKPRYVDPAGIDPAGDQLSGLSVKPPFSFQGVTCRAFPLKANIARLTQFCNSYLNMDIPPEIVYFRPALPYVYLMVLNYGSMAPSAVQAQNFGWVSQNEVTFLVPLERWCRNKSTGKPVFMDWANVSPFIFVDSEISLATGREVYGWPKVLAQVEADIPLWTTNPRSPLRLFNLSIPMFRHVYAGEAETQQVLISIDCDPSPAFAQFPLDISNPWSPLTAIPTAVRNSLSLMGEAADLLLGQRIRGFTSDRDARSLLEMGLKAGSYVARLMPEMLYPSLDRRNTDHTEEERHLEPPVPRLFNDSVTLKQFRDPEDPSRACYQALVRSRMGVNRVNKCGLLSDLSLLGGDPSGGYTIRINRHTAQPIVESLGIVVGATERGIDGSEVAILKPVLPFWTDVDLFYDKGNVICSRTNFGGKNNSRWVAEPQHAGHRHSRRRHSRNDHPDLWPLAETQNSPDHFVRDPIPYNTAQGAATQAVAGPFHFPDVTVQVYPLLADQAKLHKFLDGYLNNPLAGSGYRFKTFGSYVYLMVSVCGDQSGAMWSDNNNIGCWAEREVTFCVPVKWYHGGDDADKLISAGMIEPFVYANNGRAVTTDREVNGRPSVRATIDSPKDAWLSPKGPGERRRLLRMEIEMFPALGLGQKARAGTLLEIDERDVLSDSDEGGWRRVMDTWGRDLLADLWRKTNLASDSRAKKQMEGANTLALEILAHGAPINRISLKQYRDAQDVEAACYQALVNTPRSITHVYDIREILDRVHVRLHRVAGQPIADVLGLKIKSVDSAKGNVVDILQPVRPFWMHIAVEERLGRVVCAVKPKSPANDSYFDDPSHRERKRDWVTGHPWITGGAYTSGDTFYFRVDGFAHVGSDFLSEDPAHLGSELYTKGGAVRLGTKNKATDWLCKALTYELAWIKGALEADTRLTAELHETFEKSNPSVDVSFKRLVNATSIASYCAGASVESLMALVDAVVKEKRDILEGMYEREEASDPATEAVKLVEALKELDLLLPQWLTALKQNWVVADGIIPVDNIEDQQDRIQVKLERFIDHLRGLSNKRRVAVELSTDMGLRLQELLDNAKPGNAIGKYGEWGKQTYELTLFLAVQEKNKFLLEELPDQSGILNPIAEAYTIVEGLSRVATDWTNMKLFRRLSRKEAAVSIDVIEELQLVVESVLSKGLENRGQNWQNWEEQIRRKKESHYPLGSPRQEPDQRISVEPVMAEWAERQGLENSVDQRFGNSWFVPAS